MYAPDVESFIGLESLTGKLYARIFRSRVLEFIEEGSNLFRDVTFIDTPVIFQLINLLSEEDVVTKEYTPTVKDLRRKIKDQKANLSAWEEAELEEVIERIKSIIRADVIQEWDGNFYMIKEDNVKIRLENAATGIKSFSLLLILLRKGWLRGNTLLIVDEPEVHLHPIWQVRYAEVLVELVRKNIQVLVTTHSPYLLQAIEKFSKEKDIQCRTNFYLFSRAGKSTSCENVNESIEKIYQLFVAPVEEIL